MRRKSIDIQYRSMNQNLIFHGIPKTDPNENPKQVDFIVLYLKMDPGVFRSDDKNSITITRSHRLKDSGRPGTPPPILPFFYQRKIYCSEVRKTLGKNQVLHNPTTPARDV